MDMSRIRKPITVTIDPELRRWLVQWCKSQPAEVPFGRALDASIEAFKREQEGVEK